MRKKLQAARVGAPIGKAVPFIRAVDYNTGEELGYAEGEGVGVEAREDWFGRDVIFEHGVRMVEGEQ